MENRSRRNFIKISSAGAAAGVLLSNPLMKMATAASSKHNVADTHNVKKVPTYCEVCFWKCAGWVYKTKDGDLWKITGNDEDLHSNGRFCPRGTGGLGMYQDPDRLKKPLLRKTIDGKEVFKEVHWNEALDFISMKMKKIAAESGPESLALFKHGSGGKHFGDLFKAFGSKNITAPSYAQCRGPREAGFETTFGQAINSPEPTDIKNTKCLVLIGSHIGENMHNGHIQEMSDAIDNGATIITVDPRCSTAAAHSQYWMPIKPATDIALLLAWIHVIINEELYDKDYIQRYAYGFDELKAHVAEFTPEWAAKETNLDAEQIRTTAREMGFASPAVIIHPGRHVTWYGDDTQRTRAIAILNALLGSWGREGGFFFTDKGSLPSFPHPAFPKPKWSWKDTMEGKYPLAGLSVSNALIDASHPNFKGEHKIKGWFVVGTNLITTVPNTDYTLEAIRNLDLMVVVDTMPMEITGYADVVLPECTYIERYDYSRVSPHREPQLAVRMPATEPKYYSKPAEWMVQKLAKRLGLSAYFNYDTFDEVLDWQFKQIGSSLHEMRKKGVITLPRKKPMYLEDGAEMKFKTPTGKIELYSKALEAHGFDPMPKYTRHPQPEPGYFRLNYGRSPVHTFGRTANNPKLSDLMKENALWVNPDVAKEYSLNTGQEVWLENQDGVVSSHPIKVRVTERIGKDSVYMVHGFGKNKKELKRSFGRGINDTELITNVMMDPIMGGTGMRGNFVKFVTSKAGKEARS
jgi:thiosulfate reductase/polysulfide reductase chain A